MARLCPSLVAAVAAFNVGVLAAAQTVSGPGQEEGTNYFWPRYNYTNADLKYTSKQTLSSPYVCKWDVTVPGMNMNQGILVLPPCTYITPHWHPDTYELNFILEGNLTYWIFPYGEPGAAVPPRQGYVPQGSALVSPLGLLHLLYNDQCDILTMMHSFPTSTNEDFFSAWAFTQGMPGSYLNNALPQSPGGASMIENLSIPDGVHTLSQQCVQRCGISKQYYESFRCPTQLPLQQKVTKPFAEAGKGGMDAAPNLGPIESIKGRCFETGPEGMIAVVGSDLMIVWDAEAPCGPGKSFIHAAGRGKFAPMTASRGPLRHTYTAGFAADVGLVSEYYQHVGGCYTTPNDVPVEISWQVAAKFRGGKCEAQPPHV